MEDNKAVQKKYKELSYEEKKIRRKRIIQLVSFFAFVAFIVLGTLLAIPVARELKEAMATEEGLTNISEKLGVKVVASKSYFIVLTLFINSLIIYMIMM